MTNKEEKISYEELMKFTDEFFEEHEKPAMNYAVVAYNAYWKALKKVEDKNKELKKKLEVLEILYKLFGHVKINIGKWKGKEYGEVYFSGTDFEIDAEDWDVSIEELIKLKQWLEENE